jgi:polyhydroxyalkanoate synthesis regulator phasin
MTMAQKKKSTRKAPRPRTAQDAIRATWAQAAHTLASAETEVQKQVKALLKRRRIASADAAKVLKGLRVRLEKERKVALRQIDAYLVTFRSAVNKERKVVGRSLDRAAHRALAALDIPSRREVAELTRKIDALSKKIDAFRRRR